jgi:hypothetical protein
VLSPGGQQVQGWVTNATVLRSIARRTGASATQAPQAQPAAGRARAGPDPAPREPPTPLPGYQVLEITIPEDSPAAGQPLGAITWPCGWTPVSVAHHRQLRTPAPGLVLSPGDRINLLAPSPQRAGTAHDGQPGEKPGGPPGTAQPRDSRRLAGEPPASPR